MEFGGIILCLAGLLYMNWFNKHCNFKGIPRICIRYASLVFKVKRDEKNDLKNDYDSDYDNESVTPLNSYRNLGLIQFNFTRFKPFGAFFHVIQHPLPGREVF